MEGGWGGGNQGTMQLNSPVPVPKVIYHDFPT